MSFWLVSLSHSIIYIQLLFIIIITLQHICAAFEDIDGTHDVVGYARPLLLRSSGPHRILAVTGEMVFDRADVNFDDFPDVILHEMGHVLGIGTLWDKKDLVSGSSRCVYNTNSKASAEYRCLSGCRSGSIPLGTKCSHWSESCFGDELLTSRSDNDMHLSRLTVAALDDLGYLVNYNGADTTMTKSSLSSSCRCNRRLGEAEASFDTNRLPQPRKLSQAQQASEQMAQDFGLELLKKEQADLQLDVEEGTSALAKSTSNSDDLEAANVVSVFYKDPDTHKIAHTIVRGDI